MKWQRVPLMWQDDEALDDVATQQGMIATFCGRTARRTCGSFQEAHGRRPERGSPVEVGRPAGLLPAGGGPAGWREAGGWAAALGGGPAAGIAGRRQQEETFAGGEENLQCKILHVQNSSCLEKKTAKAVSFSWLQRWLRGEEDQQVFSRKTWLEFCRGSRRRSLGSGWMARRRCETKVERRDGAPARGKKGLAEVGLLVAGGGGRRGARMRGGRRDARMREEEETAILFFSLGMGD